MKLHDYLGAYLLSHDLSEGYRQQLDISVRLFESFCSDELESITGDSINRFLIAYAAGQLTPKQPGKRTVAAKRCNLMTLLRAAHDDGFCAEPRRVRPVKVPRTIPEAWQPGEARRMILAAQQLDRYFPWGNRQSEWWEAFIRVGWDSGLRLSDLLQLEWDDIAAGCITIVMEKTKGVIRRPLSDSTRVALRKITEPERALIFSWGFNRRHFYTQFKRLAESAGVSGTSKYLRRSGATDVARREGMEAASRFLGHADPKLAERHYVDARKLTAVEPMPTEL